MYDSNEKSNVPLLTQAQKSDFRSSRKDFSCILKLASYLLFGKSLHITIDVIVMRKVPGRKKIVACTLMNRQNYS